MRPLLAMGEATETYKKVIDGRLTRFPFGFWRPPEGFVRMVEVVRYAAAEAGVHPANITKTQMKAWGLETPLVQLCGGSTAKLQGLTKVGMTPPVEPTVEEPIKRRRTKLSNAVMSAVWLRDQGKCVSCDATEGLEFDHIIPFSKGGASTAENLRILCQACNRTRGARL